MGIEKVEFSGASIRRRLIVSDLRIHTFRKFILRLISLLKYPNWKYRRHAPKNFKSDDRIRPKTSDFTACVEFGSFLSKRSPRYRKVTSLFRSLHCNPTSSAENHA